MAERPLLVSVLLLILLVTIRHLAFMLMVATFSKPSRSFSLSSQTGNPARDRLKQERNEDLICPDRIGVVKKRITGNYER
jgi:hypothetical protein